MFKGVFSVYDAAAEAFLEPFFAPTIEFALRSFRQAVNTEGHQFNKFPEDYTLFHLGEFQSDSGHIVSNNTPHSLGVAVTMLEKAHGSQRELKLEGTNNG